ncbi:MAG TPA: winged helix DNA-binding domain-containing protein [Kribbellaceae bacterium]|nr:winged helix DNA-binding domain-containing protein [Kribbellaceae bacterium]
MRTVTIDERWARLGLRQCLAPPVRAADPLALATALVALHATDPATVHLAAAARLPDLSVAAVERALYDDRVLLRMLGMRRTMFVVPVDLAPVVQSACTAQIAVRERKLLVRHLAEAGIAADPVAADVWLKEVEDATVAALTARGTATAAELGEDVPRLRERLAMATGKAYAAQPFVTNRVLFQLGAQGRIVRGRPRGSWLSSQYHWSPAEQWLPGGPADVPPDEARAELARRWLAAFGPGTPTDLRWWAGWTATQAKQALAAVGAVEVALDGGPGYLLPDDVEPVAAPEPWVALLPALDPTPMGWKERDWFLGDHAAALFDLTGNIGPTVWADGRIIGGWAQRPDAEVVFRLLEDLGAETEQAVTAEAARLTRWLDGIRVTPRFGTPLQRELSA